MQTKKNFTKYLLITAIALLIVNVGIDLFKKPSAMKSADSKELSVKQIDSVFFSVLNEYGIEPNWITEKKINVPYEDSVKKELVVMLPADLPIPLIIKDVHDIIENDITGFVSEEKRIFGRTEIRIYSNEILKLQAVLLPDAQTIRKRNQLSFIISDAFDLSDSDFNTFLKIPFVLSAAVTPNDDSVIKADSLAKYSKEFIVVINNGIKDSKFRLETKYQKALLRNSVSNIIKLFSKARLFAVDEQSEIFNSTIYNFIRDDFKRLGVNLLPVNEFLNLRWDVESELISKFKFHCEDKSGNDQKIFFLTFDDFLKISGELNKFRKKGNRVIAVSSTELAKNINSVR